MMYLSTKHIFVPLAFLLGLSSPARSLDLPDPLPCSPCFVGQLKLTANAADPTGKTKVLGEDLYFVDPDQFVWKAGQGDITDGASIPDVFQPIIGGPFEADYLPAAVIHDHYTNRAHRVRSWRDTAKAFYQAMLINNVNVVKAKTMYFAVYAFGPHWGFIAKGVPCGKNCVFNVPMQVTAGQKGQTMAMSVDVQIPEGRVYAEEGPDFSSSHADELSDVRKKIEQREVRGAPLSLKEIEGLAVLNHGTNIFLAND